MPNVGSGHGTELEGKPSGTSRNARAMKAGQLMTESGQKAADLILEIVVGWNDFFAMFNLVERGRDTIHQRGIEHIFEDRVTRLFDLCEVLGEALFRQGFVVRHGLLRERLALVSDGTERIGRVCRLPVRSVHSFEDRDHRVIRGRHGVLGDWNRSLSRLTLSILRSDMGLLEPGQPITRLRMGLLTPRPVSSRWN